jgi:hypothetical protein
VRLTPDGKRVLGLAFPPENQKYNAGWLDVATQQFITFLKISTTYGSNKAPLHVICCWTDGRYYVGDYTGPCDCQALWSYDTQTGKLTNVTTDEKVVPSDGQPTISNGYLALDVGQVNPSNPTPGIEVYSLATRAIVVSKPSSWMLSFAWPYLVYATITMNSSGDDIETGIHALDLQTNTDVTLNTFLAGPDGATISGDTLFLTDGTWLYELDHLMTNSGQRLLLGGIVTGADFRITMLGANARVIIMKVSNSDTGSEYFLAWDRMEQHFVLLGSNPYGPPNPFFQAILSGNYLLVTSASSTGLQVTIYNTATLPIQ